MKHIKDLIFEGALAVTTLFVSCGDGLSSYIPPALHPHQPKQDEPVGGNFNRLDEVVEIHKEGEPYNSYKGLIMCGYQGWFGTPGDGSLMTAKDGENCYYHYREDGMFKPGVLRNSIDFWSDISEYEKTYIPGDGDGSDNSEHFVLPDGSYAKVYSSYDESSVMLHFKWMKDYGIDGVFMQRFLGEVINNSKHKEHFDKVLDNAMKGSDTYQRAISVMYDLSGGNESYLNAMVKDARELMNKYQLQNRDIHKFYLYENGKPLLALWGVGFNDRTYDQYLPGIITQLREQGWSIMLGCPAYWREGGNDCKSGQEFGKFQELIKSADVIMPWYVGRYDYYSFSQWHDRIAADIKWCKNNNVGYAVHCYPGGSDRNMHPNNGLDQASDQTGFRYGGKFYWNQMYFDIKAGAQSLYIGMFDEIDEGTAIFKQLNVKNVPSNEATIKDYWVNFYNDGHYSKSGEKQEDSKIKWSRLASSLNVKFQGIDDNLPTDYYLWLTGKAGQMLRGEIEMSEKIPVR